MPAFQAAKMKVQLKLCVNRLKMMQKKKANLAAVARKEIAALLEKRKDESARIKVEHIIREDFMIEALELVELYCDILLARFGLIESLKYPEDSIKEAIATLIWVTPRLSSEITELLKVRDHLTAKYGRDYALRVLENTENEVNERMIHKLNIAAPDPILVTRYLVEIAKSRGIEWAPSIEFDNELLGDDLDAENGKFGGGGGAGPGALPDTPFDHQPEPNQAPYPSDPGAHMPKPQVWPAGGGLKPLFGSPTPPPAAPSYDGHERAADFPELPPVPTARPSLGNGKGGSGGGGGGGGGGAMDAFDDLESRFRNLAPGGSTMPPPGGSAPSSSDVDFDDLTARFNMLKKS